MTKKTLPKTPLQVTTTIEVPETPKNSPLGASEVPFDAMSLLANLKLTQYKTK